MTVPYCVQERARISARHERLRYSKGVWYEEPHGRRKRPAARSWQTAENKRERRAGVRGNRNEKLRTRKDE